MNMSNDDLNKPEKPPRDKENKEDIIFSDSTTQFFNKMKREKNKEVEAYGKSVISSLAASNIKYNAYNFWLKVTICILLFLLLAIDLYVLHSFFNKIFDKSLILDKVNCELLQTFIIAGTLACAALSGSIATVALSKSILPLREDNEEDREK